MPTGNDKTTYREAEPRLRRLRGVLAERGISRIAFASACGMTPEHLSRLLRGRCGVGELGELKLRRGLLHFNIALDSDATTDAAQKSGGAA